MIIEIAPWFAVIGLGGNIGTQDEIIERFARARDAFREYGHVWSAKLYRTAPIGPAQPDFLNTAINVRIDEGVPDELIAIVLEIERLLGRDRRSEERWGPRKIDLDVLVWGPRVVHTPHIELPHPALAKRRFALQPMCDVVPLACVFPGTETPLWQLLDRVRDQPVEEVAASW